MMATSVDRPGTVESGLPQPEAPSDEERTPRYAVRRMLAAQLGRLPQRHIPRAQSEGRAHRRHEDGGEA